tara:strand:- start:1440 stop:2174 length:735 start_codon:yes stop_codon:yes gene_type:complete
MANFKILTSAVCGASTKLNEMLNGIDEFGDKLLEKLEEGPAKTAGELSTEVIDETNKAQEKLAGLVPKLPTLKSLGLQDSVNDLKLLIGQGKAYADKVAELAAAFGNLDFEKIMEATCEADNKKIVDGKVVTLPKKVKMQEGAATIEAYIKTLPSVGLDALGIGGAIGEAQKIVDKVKDGITLVKDLEKEIDDIGIDTIKKGITLVKDSDLFVDENPNTEPGNDILEINVVADEVGTSYDNEDK